jgi:glycosyltransferase involved in cell wall biosynthesis
MNMKKISVLTSLYNCENFLSDYLNALAQIEGKEQIEVLLLHNDPQETELKILKEHLPKLDFVRHILIPEREGLYKTWNRGIQLAEGKYITVWNVDDVRFPDSILQQAEALDKNPDAVIAYGDIWVSDHYGVCGSKKTNSPLDNYKKDFLKSYYISCFQMWRKSLHQTIGYYDEQFKCAGDFDFQVRAAMHFPFVKTKEPLGIYLEDQPHKLSSNGLQELENNIIYLRYGVYEKVYFFNACLSLKKYKKDALLFFNEWNHFTEQKAFHFLYRMRGLGFGLIQSCLQLIKKQKNMKTFIRKIYNVSVSYGFDPKQFLKTIKAKRDNSYHADFKELKRQKGTDNTFAFGRMLPILTEKNEEGGIMDGAYFHQDLYVAQLIHEAHPKKHLDIGSRTDGFVAHIASFRNIELIDIRPIKSNVKNIVFRQADLMDLPPDLINYCDSISSLHALEHFGLGQYGDPIDYFGYLKGINNITKILIKGGTFYFSVPIGTQRIEFNAHRVFSVNYLIDILTPSYIIKSFSYVDDAGYFFEDVELTEKSIHSNFGCWYGCGIFTLIKKND